MKSVLTLALSVFLLSAGCHRQTRTAPVFKIPIPADTNKSDTNERDLEQHESAGKIFKRIESFEKKLANIDRDIRDITEKISRKGNKGFEIEGAYEILSEINHLNEEAKHLSILEQYEQVEIAVTAIKEKIKGIVKILKSSKRYEEAIKAEEERLKKLEPKIRKYNDVRDYVVEILYDPPPGDKEIRPPLSLSSLSSENIPDLPPLCQGFGGTYQLENSPQCETWRFGNTVYFFVESNSVLERLAATTNLNEDIRNSLLAELCYQQTYGPMQLYHVGPGVGDPEMMLLQLLGLMPRGTQFGLFSINQIARAKASLKDLNIKAVAFSTKIQDHYNNIRQINSEIESKITEIEPAMRELIDAYRQALIDAAKDNRVIYSDKWLESWLKRQDRRIVSQLKEKFFSYTSVRAGASTLASQKKDRFLKLFGKDDNLENELDDLEKTFELARAEYEWIKKSLNELVFYEGGNISIYFLLEGVELRERFGTEDTFFDVRRPYITSTIKLYAVRGSHADLHTVFLKEGSVEIRDTISFLDKTEDYQRLSAVNLILNGIKAGDYMIEITLKDEYRNQTVNWSTVFKIKPAEN